MMVGGDACRVSCGRPLDWRTRFAGTTQEQSVWTRREEVGAFRTSRGVHTIYGTLVRDQIHPSLGGPPAPTTVTRRWAGPCTTAHARLLRARLELLMISTGARGGDCSDCVVQSVVALLPLSNRVHPDCSAACWTHRSAAAGCAHNSRDTASSMSYRDQ